MEINFVTKQELDDVAAKIIEAVSMLLNSPQSPVFKSKLYANAEACVYLKVCSKTLQNYRDNGLVRYTQIGRKIFYTQTDLDNFLQTFKKQLFTKKIQQL